MKANYACLPCTFQLHLEQILYYLIHNIFQIYISNLFSSGAAWKWVF